MGTILGGRLGEGLLEISAFRGKAEAAGGDDVGKGQESKGEA